MPYHIRVLFFLYKGEDVSICGSLFKHQLLQLLILHTRLKTNSYQAIAGLNFFITFHKL